MLYTDNIGRDLTLEEMQTMQAGIRWLKQQGIKYDQMRLLTFVHLDRANKQIVFTTEKRFVIIKKVVIYADSPLEKQINEARLNLRSRLFVFPRRAGKTKHLLYAPAFSKEEFRTFVGAKTPNPKKPAHPKPTRKPVIYV